MRRGALIVVVLLAWAYCSQSADAQTTFKFVNTSGGPWGVAANWDLQAVPNAPDAIAQFSSASSYQVGVNGTFDIRALQFRSNQLGTITLQAAGGLTTPQLSLNPGAGANGSIAANDGKTTLFVEAGAANQTIGAGFAGVYLGGGAAGSPVNHVWEIQGNALVTIAGQISATSGSGNTLTKVGTGTLALTANNASSLGLWTGGLFVNQGVVLINSSSFGAGTGPVTVNSGALLGGSGQLTLGISSGLANSTVINAGATLMAGTASATSKLTIQSSLGNNALIMNPNSILSVKLFGTGLNSMSRVDVLGEAIINSNQKIKLDLGALSAAQVDTLRSNVGPGNTRSYQIITTSLGLSGTGFDTTGPNGLDIVDLGAFDASEWSFGRFDTSDGVVTINFTPIPEIRSMILLSSFSLGLIQFGRKSRAWHLVKQQWSRRLS